MPYSSREDIIEVGTTKSLFWLSYCSEYSGNGSSTFTPSARRASRRATSAILKLASSVRICPTSVADKDPMVVYVASVPALGEYESRPMVEGTPAGDRVIRCCWRGGTKPCSWDTATGSLALPALRVSGGVWCEAEEDGR